MSIHASSEAEELSSSVPSSSVSTTPEETSFHSDPDEQPDSTLGQGCEVGAQPLSIDQLVGDEPHHVHTPSQEDEENDTSENEAVSSEPVATAMRTASSNNSLPPLAVRSSSSKTAPPEKRAPIKQPQEPLPPIRAHRVPSAPTKPAPVAPPPRNAQRGAGYGDVYRYPFPRATRSPPHSKKRMGWMVARTELDESTLSLDAGGLGAHLQPPKSADQALSRPKGGRKYLDELLVPKRPEPSNGAQAAPTGRRAQRYAAKWLQLHQGAPPAALPNIEKTLRSLDVARDGRTNRHQVGVHNPISFEFNPYQTSPCKHAESPLSPADALVEIGDKGCGRGDSTTPDGHESRRIRDQEATPEPDSGTAVEVEPRADVYDEDAHDMARWLVAFSIEYGCEWYEKDANRVKEADQSLPTPHKQHENDNAPTAIWAAQVALSLASAVNEKDQQAHEFKKAAEASLAEVKLRADPHAEGQQQLISNVVLRALDNAIGAHALLEFQAHMKADKDDGIIEY